MKEFHKGKEHWNPERYAVSHIGFAEIPKPDWKADLMPVLIEDETMELRRDKILDRMRAENIECAVVYEDLEHGGNFEYLTGFLTRFEEALLVLHQDGRAYLILGNENMKMAAYSRLAAEAIHAPQFSLPNQPMAGKMPMKEILYRAGLCRGLRTGICGWKLFTEAGEEELFDVPSYIVDSIREVTGGCIRNCTGLWISPDGGARTVNNANEIAHYEFGSALSGRCVEEAMDFLDVGKSEMEIGHRLGAFGQKHNVISICSTGERFEKANLYPSGKKVKRGDKVSLTTGFCGGLTSRAGYAVKDASELPEEVSDYLEKAAKPYYGAVAAWLEHIHIGMRGRELYDMIETVLPKEVYHWSLNPGHLCAEEEWLSSPFFKDSEITLKSGMIVQIDIIPSVKGYGGAGAENGIALADENLRKAIRDRYPAVWERIGKRRQYLEEVLHLSLHPEVLPLADNVAYYRPFFLNKECAFIMEGKGE